jgi:hypothetical protein
MISNATAEGEVFFFSAAMPGLPIFPSGGFKPVDTPSLPESCLDSLALFCYSE